MARIGSKEYWDGHYERYPNSGLDIFRMKKQHMLYRSAAKEILPGKMLDVACGLAPILGAIGKRIDDYHGTDLSTVSLIRLLGERPGLRGKLVVADSSRLPYSDDEFDVVTLFEVLEHLEDSAVSNTLREAWRVLKSGGRILVTVPFGRLQQHESHLRYYFSKDMSMLMNGFTDDFDFRVVCSWFLLRGSKA